MLSRHVGSGPAELELRNKLRSGESAGKVVIHGLARSRFAVQGNVSAVGRAGHFAHTEGVTIAPREAMVHGVVPLISGFVGLKTDGRFKTSSMP